MAARGESRTSREQRALVVDGVLAREFPRLARLLGGEERRRLASEFVRSRPFYRGEADGLERLLPDFLSVALADDPDRGAWLPEFAQLEGALGRAARAPRLAEGPGAPAVESFAFEHRVDELLRELGDPGGWSAPRPATVRIGVWAGRDGVRCEALAPGAPRAPSN